MLNSFSEDALKRLALLLQSEEALASWLETLVRRSWTLRANHDRSGETSHDLLEVVHERCGHFLRTLGQAVAFSPSLELGGAEFREAVQSLSFTAGWMAGAGLAMTDALGLVHSLEEVLATVRPVDDPSVPRRFFEALSVVAAEAYCAALAQKAQARYRDAMEKVQLVSTLHPRLPCLFLVGEPDLQALDDAIGRLMMLAVMCEAKAVVIDATGLFRLDPVLKDVLKLVLDVGREMPAHVVLAGATPQVIRELAADEGASERVTLHEQLPPALEHAASLSGLSWPAIG
jgi:hypothetical protein